MFLRFCTRRLPRRPSVSSSEAEYDERPHLDPDLEEADNVLASSGSTGTKNKTAALGIAEWVSVAAAPTFAIMALLVGASSEASPLSGMVRMYVLMAVFESVAWLKLISNRRSGSRKGWLR